MTKIFISHSSKDTEFARQLAQALTEVGISVWIDVADIPAGMNWSTAIQQALDECEAMIVVISPDAMDSTNVGNEWQYYLDEDKCLIPLRWKPAKIHFQLRRIQYVDFHEHEFTGAFEKLQAELRRQGFVADDGQGQIHVIQSDRAQTLPRVEDILPRKRWSRPLPLPKERTLLRVEDILPPPFEWIEIPGGKVTLKDASEKSPPGTKGGVFEIPNFGIAKYPITQAQYQVFTSASDGYADPQWWNFSDEAELLGRVRWPRNYTDCPPCPRTEVTWFDAIAFCRWLSVKTGLQITVPTEQQWQRAAIGDKEWKYPWGNDFDRNRCNTRESDLKRTTSVTQYLLGWSPYGVTDMSGNAWEWCLNDWQTENTDIQISAKLRSVRGSAWDDSRDTARASHRSFRNPYDGPDDQGFRIVTNL